MILKRFILGILVFVFILILPWWIYGILIVFFTFYFNKYYEVFLFGIIIDLLYGVPNLVEIPILSTLLAGLIFLISCQFKKVLKYY